MQNEHRNKCIIPIALDASVEKFTTFSTYVKQSLFVEFMIGNGWVETSLTNFKKW